MTTSHLILIRHSTSYQDPSRPAHEWILSAEGFRRAALLVERMRPHRLAAVYASTEPKATQTGQLLADALNLPFATDPDLGEQRRRTVPYLGNQAAFRAQIRALLTNPDALIYGEETGRAAGERLGRALRRIVASLPNQSVAVVSHGTIMALFAAQVAGVDPVSFWEALQMPSYVAFSLPDWRIVENQFDLSG